MADWIGKARTNYFRVKNAAKFEAEMRKYDVTVWRKDKATYALGANTEDGGWPRYEADTGAEFEFYDIIIKHLAKGQICVAQTIGAIELRYFTAYAEAFDNTGASVYISLNDIYPLARKTFGIEPPRAEY